MDNSASTLAFIQLNGHLQSDLDWQLARQAALKAIDKGQSIFWQIDLGLFKHLNFPLTHQVQYLSLGVSLEHFCHTLGKEFVEHSIGLSIYNGSADFSTAFSWDEEQVHNWRLWLRKFFTNEAQAQAEIGVQWSSFEQAQVTDCYRSAEGHQVLRFFCRDVAVEYMSLITNKLPAAIDPYLLLDLNGMPLDELSMIRLMHPQFFERLHVSLQGTTLPLPYKTWKSLNTDELLLEPAPIKRGIVGVCLPNFEHLLLSQWQDLREPLQVFSEKTIAYRLIAEEDLTSSWDELDFLLYVPQALSIQGKRKLLGFCAAGGTVISANEITGKFPYEVSWQEWKTSHL